MIHRNIGSLLPQGWDHQLKDEPGLVLTSVRKWRYFPGGWGPTQVELSPHVGLSLGNVYTYGAAGLMLRWGTHLRYDIGPPNIRPGFPGANFFLPKTRPNWYLFGGVETRLVARNIFLDGNTFQGGPSVEKKPVVADLQFGLAFHVGRVRIALSNVYRSKEFEGQREPTQYGAINITVATN